jgi:trigger factor
MSENITGISFQIEEQPLEGLFRKLIISCEGDKIKKTLEEIYTYLSQTANIPGFRKGRIPKKLLRKRFKGTIENVLINEILNEILPKILEEKKITPVADVLVDKVEIEEDKNNETKIIFEIRFEVPPKIEVKNPEEIEVKIPKREFNKEEALKRAIEQIREQNAQWVSKDGVVEKGDLVEIEYEIVAKDKNEKESGKTMAVIGEGVLRKEIEEALINKKKGEIIELKDIPLKDVEGRDLGKADIKVKILEIKKKEVPEFNEELVKKLGLGETLEEAKEKIAKELEESFKREVEEEKKQRILNELVAAHKFTIPQTLVGRELKILVDNRLEELRRAYNISPQQVNIEELSKELLPLAVFSVASRLILDEYAKKFNIEVSEEEINQEIEKLAKLYNVPAEELKKEFEEKGLIEGLKQEIRRAKTLEELTKKVKIVYEEENTKPNETEEGKKE